MMKLKEISVLAIIRKFHILEWIYLFDAKVNEAYEWEWGILFGDVKLIDWVASSVNSQ